MKGGLHKMPRVQAKSPAKGPWWTLPYVICVVIFLFLVSSVVCWWSWKRHAMALCNVNNLQLTAGQQSGAAGTIYQNMNVKNTGKRTCAIGGYPAAFLYGNDGYAVGSSAALSPNPAPTAVTLAPGETAHTTLGFPQHGNFPSGSCSSGTSTMLKLYLPGSTDSLQTTLEEYWCPGFSATAMQPGS